MNTPMERLADLTLHLPKAPEPGGVYAPCLVVGNLVYVSGHLPFYADGTFAVGHVGQDGLSKEEAKKAAHQVGQNILATLLHHIGSLDKIERVVKVLGMIHSTSDFKEHAFVMNGCTELFVAIWEEKGLGARSSVGMSSLPKGVPVEIEGIFLLRE
jgi:enamine deaminase RidA (YjgF/YER057c/UK114 family)